MVITQYEINSTMSKEPRLQSTDFFLNKLDVTHMAIEFRSNFLGLRFMRSNQSIDRMPQGKVSPLLI